MARIFPQRWLSGHVLRVLVLLIATIIALGVSQCKLASVKSRPVKPQPFTTSLRQETAKQYLEQSNNLITWSLAVIGGIIAVVVTTKVHRVKYCEDVFVIIGPTTMFMFMSIVAGWRLRRRMTNLVASGDYSDVTSLGKLLLRQSDLFIYALIGAVLFSLWFLINIVIGAATPYETERKAI